MSQALIWKRIDAIAERLDSLEKDSHPPVLTVPTAEMERIVAGFSAEVSDLRRRVALLERGEGDLL